MRAVSGHCPLGQLLRCLHPPAGALTVLLVLLAAAYHRLSGLGHRYPVHWL